MANKHRKVWKVVSRKLLSGKQTWPYIHKEFNQYLNKLIETLAHTQIWRIIIPRGCSSSKSFRYRELGRDALAPPKSEVGFQNWDTLDETWIKLTEQTTIWNQFPVVKKSKTERVANRMLMENMIKCLAKRWGWFRS